MARVPVVSGSGPALQGLPSQSLRPAGIYEGAAQIGEALQKTGAFVQTYADEQQRIDNALDMAAVKRADAEDAKWIRERLHTGENAYFKSQGFNAANGRKPLEEEVKARRDAARAALTTERQRRIYDMAAESRFGPELEGVARHAQRELLAEEKRQSLALLTEHGNDAVTYWNDDTRREKALAGIRSELRDQAVKGGWSDDVLARAEKESVTNVYRRTISGLIDQGEVEKASAFLARHRDEMDVDAANDMAGALYRPLLARKASGVVDMLLGTVDDVDVSSGRAVAAGEVLPRMVQITAMAESGNRETDSRGRRITSPKGAQGIMQVMPGTQRDPGFGVRPSNGTPEDDARVGRDYLAALMNKYGNDPAKAWAAYNWGPGNLDNHLKANGGRLVVDKLPQETQAYVRGNLAALGGSGGVQQQPREHDMAKLLARVDQLNLPFDEEQAVRAELARRVALDESLLERQRKAAEDQAFEVAQGLGKGFTSIDQLPPSVVRQLDPRQREFFRNMAERNLNADRGTDWSAYSTYSDEYASNPAQFLRRSPAELRGKLSDSEFEEVMGWRRSALQAGGRSGGDDKQVTHERIRSVTNPLLLAAGIAKPAGTRVSPEAAQAYAQRVGKFRSAVAADIAIWQKANPGKLPDDDTIAAIADRQLLKVYEQGRERRELGYAFEVEGGAAVVGRSYNIPNAARSAIISQYRARFGREPSNAEINRIYLLGPRGGR
jgi:hypothetical protein